MALALVIAVVAVPGWLFRANEHTGPEPFNNGPYQAALAIAAVLFLGGAVLERKD